MFGTAATQRGRASQLTFIMSRNRSAVVAGSTVTSLSSGGGGMTAVLQSEITSATDGDPSPASRSAPPAAAAQSDPVILIMLSSLYLTGCQSVTTRRKDKASAQSRLQHALPAIGRVAAAGAMPKNRPLAKAGAILYKPGFPGPRLPAPHWRRGERHGCPETKNIALQARDAPVGGCAQATDLHRGQGFRRAPPAPSHRSQDRHVQRPAGAQGSDRSLTAFPGEAHRH